MNIEYTYYNGNNYMKIYLERENIDYKLEMIKAQHISGLLMVEEHEENGKKTLWYQMNSMQSLASRYATRPLSRDTYERMINGLLQLEKELDKYLLDIHDIIMHPDFIFQDIKTKEFSFVYFPEYGKALWENVLDFYLFLLEHIDQKDDEYVRNIYSNYDSIDEAGDFFHMKLLLLEKEESIPVNKEPMVDSVSDIGENGCDNLPNDVVWEKTDLDVESHTTCPATMSVNSDLASPVSHMILRFVLFAVLDVVFFVIVHSYRLIMLRYLIVIMLFLVSIEFLFLLFGVYKKPKEILGEQYENNHKEEIDYVKVRSNDYGKTVFLDPDILPEERKLYGMGKGNSYIFSLENLPFTIGKEREMVEGILPHESISRMHARILEEGASVYMEDLNSTNGTFKNGVRLQPFEKVMIEPGDEVKFGQLRFSYR